MSYSNNKNNNKTRKNTWWGRMKKRIQIENNTQYNLKIKIIEFIKNNDYQPSSEDKTIIAEKSNGWV